MHTTSELIEHIQGLCLVEPLMICATDAYGRTPFDCLKELGPYLKDLDWEKSEPLINVVDCEGIETVDDGRGRLINHILPLRLHSAESQAGDKPEGWHLSRLQIHFLNGILSRPHQCDEFLEVLPFSNDEALPEFLLKCSMFSTLFWRTRV